MWTWAIRLGKWALTAWGLTEVASEVSENLAETGTNTNKAARNIGVTIAIGFGLYAFVLWFLNRKKSKRR